VRAGQNARLGKNCSLSRFELVCDAREAALRLGLRASPRKIASGRLYYFGARYYDPRTSVWQSADAILGKYLGGAAGGLNQPINFALYTYGRNNPIAYKDPDGNIVFLAAIPWIVGTISAAMTGYEIGSTGYGLYSGAISPKELAGDVGKNIAVNTALKAVPGGAAAVVARKLHIETYLKKGTELFRVHGKNNKGVEGRSWTTENPQKIDNYRDVAGLPDVNTGETLLKGELKEGSFVGSRKALPLDGNKGGLPETLIKDAEAKVNVKETIKLEPPL